MSRIEGRQSIGSQLLRIFGVAVAMLSIVPFIALVAIALLLPNYLLLLVAIAVPLAIAGYLYLTRRNYVDSVLSSVGAQHSTTDIAPRFHNLVESLSLNVGVDTPEVYIVQDPCVNAFALADSERTCVGITAGAVQVLGLTETEGVVGALLARLSSGDAQQATVAAGVFGFMKGGVTERFADWATSDLIQPNRDLASDRGSVALTNYPPGLRGALMKCAEFGFIPKSAPEEMNEIWLVNPASANLVKTPIEALSSVDLRIDVLGSQI